MRKKSILWGLVSCCLVVNFVFAATQKEKKPSSLAQPVNISKELHTWNQKQSLPLQEHQLIPIAYLEQNKHLKGLLINHYLGTGKTLLAIGFAERNPGRAVIILGPSFLEGHWTKELQKYGVKDKSRYRFVSHHNPNALIDEDLSESIVIIDESHRLIEKVRAKVQHANYSKLYFNLRKAHKILSLTGTLIYSDLFDLVYQINLVSGKEELPFNQEKFRIDFSSVNIPKSYWRGHLLESNYIPQVVLCSSVLVIGAQVDPMLCWLALPATMIGSLMRTFMPVGNAPIRDFDTKKLAAVIQKYISYYNFDHDKSVYPSQTLTNKKLSYNSIQLEFLLRFYDSSLNNNELMQLLKDESLLNGSDALQREELALNGSSIQDVRKIQIGAGREIGNLIFHKTHKNTKNLPHLARDSKVIFPEKFKNILKEIKCSNGPVVVYSHYYYNGLLLFKQFLDASEYKGNYRVFHPEMSHEEHIKIVEEYNNNKVKILLLHPDITEGISLQGTRQLHFLEMPVNNSLKNQIIGRAVRYRSHLHLPKNEQKVQVYIWEYILSMVDLKAQTALRENWYHNFGELSYYSDIGNGRIQVDKNAALKKGSPDTAASIYVGTLNKQVEDFRRYIKIFCIEKYGNIKDNE